MRGKARKSAFSVMELIVIAAMVVVIVSLLAPFFRAARQRARLTHCATNLRTLYISALNYVDDHDGFLMSRSPARDRNYDYGGYGPMPDQTFRDHLPERFCRSKAEEMEYNDRPASNPTRYLPLNSYIGDWTTLICPSDEKMYLSMGTSYPMNRLWAPGTSRYEEIWTLGGPNAEERRLLRKIFKAQETVLFGDLSMHYWWGGENMGDAGPEYATYCLFHQRLTREGRALSNAVFLDGRTAVIAPRLRANGQGESHGEWRGVSWKFYPGRYDVFKKGAYILE